MKLKTRIKEITISTEIAITVLIKMISHNDNSNKTTKQQKTEVIL